MKKVILGILALVFGVVACGAVMAPEAAYAENEFTKKGCELATTEEQKAALGCDQEAQASSTAKNLINAAISILGIVAVAILIVAGQRYIVARGDANLLTQARNMIIAGVVGLIVAILAFAIVNFILGSVFQ